MKEIFAAKNKFLNDGDFFNVKSFQKTNE
jgi:hypothetical protein